MASKLVAWAITASLAGFLFGFDTVVISGAEEEIQGVWNLSAALHGLAMSMALWGTVVGSMIGGSLSDKFGRKKMLVSVGILYMVSALWSAVAMEVYSFMVARFIGGVGVGISTVAAPLFISEVAPPEMRGRLTGLFQFCLVFGILVAFVSNAIISSISGENGWRWMLGIEAVPALVYTVLSLGLPESPRWLIAHGDGDAAGKVIQLASPHLSEFEVKAAVEDIVSVAGDNSSASGFWTMRMKKPILLAFFISFFNQLSGINAVLYFAPRIFKLAGLEEEAALLQSIGIGVTNLIATFVGVYLIDQLGRRTLMFIGSIGYILSLGLTAWAFHAELYTIVAPCIFVFVAAHAVGQGSCIWVFISEIFPSQHRGNGQSFGCSVHWIFAALITAFFPSMVEFFPTAGVFGFFAFMMCLQLLWVKAMMPETKGLALEQIQIELGVASASTVNLAKA